MQREYIDKCTVYSTVVGSNAYGTNTPESDTDIRGIAVINDLSYYYGFLNSFQQFEDKVNDYVIYDIRKAFKLISDCNPNMIDLLFTDERFHIKVIDVENNYRSTHIRTFLGTKGYKFVKRIGCDEIYVSALK